MKGKDDNPDADIDDNQNTNQSQWSAFWGFVEKWQVLIGIVGSLAAILSAGAVIWSRLDSRLASLDSQITAISTRQGTVEGREEGTNKLITALNERAGNIEKANSKLTEDLGKTIEPVSKLATGLEAASDALDRSTKVFDEKLVGIEKSIGENKRILEGVSDRLLDAEKTLVRLDTTLVVTKTAATDAAKIASSNAVLLKDVTSGLSDTQTAIAAIDSKAKYKELVAVYAHLEPTREPLKTFESQTYRYNMMSIDEELADKEFTFVSVQSVAIIPSQAFPAFAMINGSELHIRVPDKASPKHFVVKVTLGR